MGCNCDTMVDVAAPGNEGLIEGNETMTANADLTVTGACTGVAESTELRATEASSLESMVVEDTEMGHVVLPLTVTGACGVAESTELGPAEVQFQMKCVIRTKMKNKKWTIQQLKAKLKQHSVCTSGCKSDLLDRLTKLELD